MGCWGEGAGVIGWAAGWVLVETRGGVEAGSRGAVWKSEVDRSAREVDGCMVEGQIGRLVDGRRNGMLGSSERT